MKVLMTTDTVGGVWQYALTLSQALGDLQVKVVLATMGAPLTLAQRREADALDNLLLEESTFKLIWQQDPWDDIQRAGDWLLDLAARHEPALVHLNDYAHGDLPWQVPVLMVGHSCVTSWWQAVKGEPPPAEWDRYRHTVSRGLNAATRVVAPSRTMLQALERHYGPLPQGQVIANGRSGFAPGLKQPFVLAAGRLWDEAKNIATLAKAAPGLPWPVRIAGEARHPHGGESSFANVQSLGPLDAAAIRGQYARAEIYALPARYEPFGLSALEAALSGCALVLGDIPSLREVWGQSALFVPPDDPTVLHDTLRALIDDPPRRRALADQARLRARTFSPERMAQAYREAYGALVRHWADTTPGALAEHPFQLQ